MKTEQAIKYIKWLESEITKDPYCDNCKFGSLTEKECENEFGYYACDNCHRKDMNWEYDEKRIERYYKEVLNEFRTSN
jgi:hypothetical protein